MREILFRGKRTYNGKWVEGSLVLDNGSAYIISTAETERNIKILVNSCSINVGPETVGQYTGLKDKNGVKIFEGDIVKCLDTINDIEFNAVVEFGNPNHEYNWGYQLKHISGDMPNLDILCWVDMEETGAFIEVIGNIYDSPELLGAAAKIADKNIAQSGLAPATENFELMEG